MCLVFGKFIFSLRFKMLFIIDIYFYNLQIAKLVFSLTLHLLQCLSTDGLATLFSSALLTS